MFGTFISEDNISLKSKNFTVLKQQGAQRPLTASDMWGPPKHCKTDNACEQFEVAWEAKTEKSPVLVVLCFLSIAHGSWRTYRVSWYDPANNASSIVILLARLVCWSRHGTVIDKPHQGWLPMGTFLCDGALCVCGGIYLFGSIGEFESEVSHYWTSYESESKLPLQGTHKALFSSKNLFVNSTGVY